MAGLTLNIAVETLRLSAPFRISGHIFDSAEVIVVTLGDGAHHGRGEAAGVYYADDDLDHMLAQLDAARGSIEAGVDRASLRQLMRPGGARNAVDAALWELESHRMGRPVWQLAGLASPKPLRTTFTIGADEPAVMAAQAQRYGQAQSIKVKLTGEFALDVARVAAIRAARPDVWLGVDANQGFDIGDLDALVEAMAAQQVSLIEQPLRRGREADLSGYHSEIPIAADESVLSLADIPNIEGRFDIINIKLDKCGGLTEALEMVSAARELGLGVMVGNMISSSLAMAPAFLVGQLCDLVDIDGPIFLSQDRVPGVEYRGGMAWCPEKVWGATVAA
jgi:L-Ala-D/L-Glu epimerase